MTREELKNGVLVLDGRAKLYVSKDEMEAYLVPTVDELGPDVLEMVPQLLEDASISYGILPVPEPEDGQWLLAKGTLPIKGEDGRIELFVETPGSEKQTDEDADTEETAPTDPLYIDPRELNTIINVRKGQEIARKIPPTPGTPGTNIFGEEIPSQPGKWIAFKPGEGVEILDDFSLVATRDGKVDVSDEGIISVLDEWTIDGSVDASVGHVIFWGRKLVVAGSVLGGFKVQVDGDLTIKGNIEDETFVCAGGNLNVEGIVRAEKTDVEVGGDLSCMAIEYANVKVGGDMEVQDYILDATCIVGGHVWVIQGKGLIAGGKTFLARSLAAKVLGTAANVPTEIQAGYDIRVKKLYEKTVFELEDLTKKKEDVEAGLLKLKVLASKGRLDRKKEFIRNRLCDALKAIVQAREQRKALLSELENRLGQMQQATIQALEKVYANTTIGIGNVVLELRHDVEKARFIFRQGKICITHIKES